MNMNAKIETPQQEKAESKSVLPDPNVFAQQLTDRLEPQAVLKNVMQLTQLLSYNESVEFKALLVQYCASHNTVTALENIPWEPLSIRLGTSSLHLAEAAKQMNADNSLWTAVLGERIRRTHSSKFFRDLNWEKLEQAAVGKLLILLDRGMIRDPGELLAIAAAAKRSAGPNSPNSASGGQGNGSLTQFNVNIGGPAADGLPAAGTKISIDMSPRMAAALQRSAGKVESKDDSGRVIDGEMIGPKELRALLTERVDKPFEETEVQQENEE